LASVNECVATHLPNGAALKMDGGDHLAETVPFMTSRGACRWGRRLCVNAGGRVDSADLGGSSRELGGPRAYVEEGSRETAMARGESILSLHLKLCLRQGSR
jgi:hypothetical protein